jgi:UDPglucose--hexose-1-phosphate uridylyltransferase
MIALGADASKKILRNALLLKRIFLTANYLLWSDPNLLYKAQKHMNEFPHRRFNPLTREWVLVSPQRTKRPWLGQLEKTPPQNLPEYDPDCYLCPGNSRAEGVRNPHYSGTFVFDNDFPALLPAAPDMSEMPQETSPLFASQSEMGVCRVICFSPRHDLTLPELPLANVEAVVRTWADQTADLGSLRNISCVQVFENKGDMMGCSNPHPHGQVWAQSSLSNEMRKELESQSAYFANHRRPLLLDYVEEETRRAERIVAINEHFIALVPFWAIWPFEILLVARRSVADLSSLGPAEITNLADLIKRVTTRYDNLFEISFPYSMGFHQAPADGAGHPEWVLHAHYYPPLLRSATVRKFMVGFEMLGMPQRDLTPEVAAQCLRALSDHHYKQRQQ